MDKLKAQLAVVTKHSFWIMCGGILIVCLASWWVATGKLAQQQKTQLDAITTNFTAMSTLRSNNQKHPNTSTAEGMAQLVRGYSVEVMRGWQLQYDQQATVLVWPASFDEVFRGRVDKLRPIEVVPPPPTPIDKDLPIRERQLYRDFIADELPALAKTIGTDWRAVATATAGDGFGGGSDSFGPGGRGMGTMPSVGPSGFGPGTGSMPGDAGNPNALVEDKSIVIWNAANQQELLGTHFGFITREEPPSTLDVLYAQEDLWILQNIMDIIRAANRDTDGKDATARHEATVKMIDFVRIGRSAMGLAGQITPVGAAAGAGGMTDGGYGGGSMGMGPTGGSMGMGPTGGSMATPGGDAGAGANAMMPGSAGSADGMGGAALMSTDPAYGRYVDETYKSLDPKRLRDALTSKSPADALLAVAKRMPVRMRFTIDQRRLNRLLAECGNSRLPVEVRQVRVNREPAAAGGGGNSYSSGGMDGGGGMMSGMGGMGGYRGGMGGSGMGGSGMGGSGMSGMGSGYGSADGGGSMPGMAGMPGAPRRVGGADSTATIDLNLIDVELYGIVYVYNPVNKSQLGLEETLTTAATPPAVTPTTPATPVSSPAPAGDAPVATGVAPPAAIVPAVVPTP